MNTKREYLNKLDNEELNGLLSLTEEAMFAKLLDYFQIEQQEIATRLSKEEIVDPGKFTASEFALYKIGIANGINRFIEKLKNLQAPLKAELKRREEELRKSKVVRKDLQMIHQSI